MAFVNQRPFSDTGTSSSKYFTFIDKMKTAISNMGFNNYADNKPITAKKQQKHRCSKY